MEKTMFKRFQSPVGYVLNCFEKEVVLFLVFNLTSRFLSATLYFVINQSLMWQETVLCERKLVGNVIFFFVK